MFFLGKFFIMMFLFFFATGAQAECCWCECDPECHCPMGMDWGGGNDCSNPCGNVDCVAWCGSEEPGQYCSDSFTDECPTSAPAGRLCRIVEQNCNQVSGCKKYELCNPNNGTTGEYVVSDSCHLENGTCYSNHRNCNLFEAIVYRGGEWNNSQNENEIMKCLKTEQSGTAEWKPQQNKWDVSGCRCKHNGLIWYKNCTGVYVMKPRQGYSLISKVSDEIDYECEPPLMYYCKGCGAGAWIGETIGWPVYSGTRCSYSLDANGSDDLTGTYTVCSCSTVDAGYYSTGCNFSYPLHSITNPSGCEQSCPAGYSTPEAGATSENDCEFDTSALFHDATGDFILGNMTNCPTNGG